MLRDQVNTVGIWRDARCFLCKKFGIFELCGILDYLHQQRVFYHRPAAGAEAVP
jgi:hypothetical protein